MTGPCLGARFQQELASNHLRALYRCTSQVPVMLPPCDVFRACIKCIARAPRECMGGTTATAAGCACGSISSAHESFLKVCTIAILCDVLPCTTVRSDKFNNKLSSRSSS